MTKGKSKAVSQIGRPQKTEFDRHVCRFWIAHLLSSTGISSAAEFACKVLLRPEQARTWTGYETGMHSPNGPHTKLAPRSKVMIADEHVPDSARYFTTPMWSIVQGNAVSAPEIQAALNDLPEHTKILLDAAAPPVINIEKTAQAAGTQEVGHVSFRTLECVVLLMADARMRGDRVLENQLSSYYERQRNEFMELPCMENFRAIFFPLLDASMALTSTEQQPFQKVIILPSRTLSEAPTASRAQDHTDPVRVRTFAGIIAAILSAMLVLADAPTPSQAVIILLALVVCLSISVSTKAFNFRSDLAFST